eukprot:8959508-Pyramimonas_sp.AAC.1
MHCPIHLCVKPIRLMMICAGAQVLVACALPSKHVYCMLLWTAIGTPGYANAADLPWPGAVATRLCRRVRPRPQ